MTASIVLAGCWLLVAVPVAIGATVKWDLQSAGAKAERISPYVEFTAAAGETNVVSVTPGAPLPTDPPTSVRLVIRDEGAPITSFEGCTRIDAANVSCPQAEEVFVDTGDMNDSVTMSVGGTVRGGAGDDRLMGGAARDLLAGEDGADTLLGGGGDDTVVATEASGATATDTIDGGEGKDTVSYAGRRAAVSVEIGAASNEDKLTSMESVTGGGGNDTLVGDDGDNALSGGSGKDVLRGRGGADALDGGEGDDRLSLGNRGGTTSCGHGQDTIVSATARDLVPANCERVALTDSFVVIGPPKRVGRAAKVRCAFLNPKRDKVSRIMLYKGRSLLGRTGRVRRSGSATIMLNRAGRRLAKRGATVVVRAGKGFAYSVRMR